MAALGFGTDGVRGEALTVLTTDYVTHLGRVAASVLGPGPWYVGRDTRESGPTLESALAAGLNDAGADVVTLGVAPTPAVAWAAASTDRPGAMISASHNPWSDNGVKLFAPGGRKLDDAAQAELTRRLGSSDVPTGRAGATSAAGPEVLDGYADAVLAAVEGRLAAGLRVVVDGANGANSRLAPAVLGRLGVDLVTIHDEPDGRNINAGCGSTHLDDLSATVVAESADFGLAFDGDADRVLAVDASGRLVDGDQLIGMCALDRHRRGRLTDDTVVVTVMTNLGFHLGMAEHGIRVEQTAVGDRYVLEALDRGGWSLGGEQSGHIIFRDLATTGDGLLTSVVVADLVARSGRSLAELADEAMTRLPQTLVNVRLDTPVDGLLEAVAPVVAEVEAELGDHGRVLLRPSGTEPVVRVMVEAPAAATAAECADRLARAVADAAHVGR